MPRAKSAPVKLQKQIGSWGGRRKGAGRKRELTVSDRRELASDYHPLPKLGKDGPAVETALLDRALKCRLVGGTEAIVDAHQEAVDVLLDIYRKRRRA